MRKGKEEGREIGKGMREGGKEGGRKGENRRKEERKKERKKGKKEERNKGRNRLTDIKNKLVVTNGVIAGAWMEWRKKTDLIFVLTEHSLWGKASIK